MEKFWLNNTSRQVTYVPAPLPASLFLPPFFPPLFSPFFFFFASFFSFFLLLAFSLPFCLTNLSSSQLFFSPCIVNFLRLSGIKQQPFFFFFFFYAHYCVGQEFKKGIIRMACLISTVSGASAKKIQMVGT